jgi:hypothetical protein
MLRLVFAQALTEPGRRLFGPTRPGTTVQDVERALAGPHQQGTGWRQIDFEVARRG